MKPRKRSVLLVDDDAIVRKRLRTLFDAAGLICSEAKDGAEALDEAGKRKPDLIVLDYSMPVMNGLQAVPPLKEILPDTPILIFTMFANPQSQNSHSQLSGLFEGSSRMSSWGSRGASEF